MAESSTKVEKPLWGFVGGLPRDIAVDQPWYRWQTDQWVSSSPVERALSPSQTYSILSWNIDFRRSFTKERMLEGLQYLKDYVARISHPTIIMLVENLESDLDILTQQEWVRDGYQLTDTSSESWEHRYGTCILVPKTLRIARTFRVHYSATQMGRDALFVDIDIGDTQLRVCSTHLESLVATPPLRPSQVATAAKWMHDASASILGGDLNAIEPFDKKLHIDNQLKDAYLELGGIEDDHSGMTWGEMVPNSEKKFGFSRMDKLYYCGKIALQNFELFGHDVQLASDHSIAKTLKARDGLDKAWVTDHLGVKADFRIYTAQAQPSPRASEKL